MVGSRWNLQRYDQEKEGQGAQDANLCQVTSVLILVEVGKHKIPNKPRCEYNTENTDPVKGSSTFV